MNGKGLVLFGAGFLACLVLIACVGVLTEGSQAEAKPSPVKALPERDVYYPGTEELAPDEMRVTACGTGMPNARPKQAAACWLVELGNGDKLIFDIGTGSAERLSAMKIPYDYLDKVFLGHLHSDHFGDMDLLWVGGVVGNRLNPMRVWGPSGHKPEYGTAYAIEHMEKMLTWDKGSRLGNVDIRGLEIDEDLWPQPATRPKLPPDLSQRIGFSKEIMAGREVFKDVVKKLYDDINEKYGSDVKPPI